MTKIWCANCAAATSLELATKVNVLKEKDRYDASTGSLFSTRLLPMTGTVRVLEKFFTVLKTDDDFSVN